MQQETEFISFLFVDVAAVELCVLFLLLLLPLTETKPKPSCAPTINHHIIQTLHVQISRD